MPFYTYIARNTVGKTVRDSIEAASPELARASLRSAGFTPYEIRKQSFFERDFNIPLMGKPKSKDMAIFCRQFSSILRAGVPVTTALSMMEEQTGNKQLKSAVRDMQGEVEKGHALAAAMGKHRKLFPPILVSMVRAGEESGNLESVFIQMEAYFDKAQKTKSSVSKTMIYPVILLIVMIIVMIVMMTMIVPMFMETFESVGAELPPLTQKVVAFSSWMGRWWWLLLLLAAVFAAGCALYGRTNSGRHVFGMIALKTPVLGKLIVRSSCATMCRMLSLLLASGLTLLESLDLAASNMSNIYYEEAVQTARTLVSEGWSLNVSLRDTGRFPPLVTNMVSVGENSGDLQGVLSKLADFYDQEVSDQTAKLLALLEPMMILFMAVFVIIIVFSIYLPMLNMTKAYDQYLE